jgi:hypothetical protein
MVNHDEMPDEDGSRGFEIGMHRVSSHVGTDGSAEVVLSSAPALFAAAEPMTRIKSMPLGGTSYAMRRVRSRDDRAQNAAAAMFEDEAEGVGSLSYTPSSLFAADPITRTKSTPSGGMSYALTRVLSRDDRYRGRQVVAAVSEKEDDGLVGSRVKGVYKRGGVETVLDENYISPPPALVKTKSALSQAEKMSHSVRKVFWKSALKNREADGLMSSRVDANEDRFEDNDNEASFLQGSGYGLRKINSTPPLQEGLDSGDARKRTKSSGCEEQSSLYDDEKVYGPLSLVRNRLSFLGQKVTVGGEGGEQYGKGKGADADDLSTVAESIDSSPSRSTAFRQKKKKKKKKSKYFTIQVLFAIMMIVSGITGASVYLLKADNDDIDTSVSNVVITTNNEVDATPKDDKSVEESVEATAGDDSLMSLVADGKPDLESTVSNVTDSDSSFVDGDLFDEATTATETIFSDANEQSTTTTTQPPPEDTITIFYVMADAPYDDDERYNLMPKHIEELGDDGEFLVHLGDLQFAEVDKCREGAYDEASSILQKARMPTFILPGDNDINDCDKYKSISHGEDMWTKYFGSFDLRYEQSHSFDVTRWGKLNESFAFIHKQVLYLGLNIIGGKPYSESEQRKRHSQHLERINSIMNDRSDDYKVVVLLAHAEPTSRHEDFFEGNGGFISIVEEMGKPTMHFHGDWHEYYEREAEYGAKNYMRISLDGESIAPPIRVTIDVSKKNPIKFDRRSRDLEVACCSEGWPRYDGKVVNTPRPE